MNLLAESARCFALFPPCFGLLWTYVFLGPLSLYSSSNQLSSTISKNKILHCNNDHVHSIFSLVLFPHQLCCMGSSIAQKLVPPLYQREGKPNAIALLTKCGPALVFLFLSNKDAERRNPAFFSPYFFPKCWGCPDILYSPVLTSCAK